MRRLWIILLVLFGIFPIQAQESICNGLPIVTFDGWQGDLNALLGGFCVDDTQNLYYQPGLPTWQSHNGVPLYFTTRAIWQAQGVIERTAAFNGVNLDGYEGAVALNSCAMVGNTVWVRRNATERWIRAIDADCSANAHVYYHAVAVGSGIELSYQLAEAFGEFDTPGIGLYGFEVCTGNPDSDCLSNPVDYSQWFLENVQFIQP